MARRRRRGAGITLFAFQDIIMSTTGVVIMIVLLLTLELLQRPSSGGTDQPPVRLETLTEQIDRAAKEIARLETSLRASEQVVSVAASQSAAEIQDQIATLEEQLERLSAEAEDLRAERAAHRSAHSELQERLEKEQLASRAAQAERQADELDRQLQAGRSQNRPIFKTPRGSRESGWVVVIAADRIEAAPLGKAARPHVFPNKGRSLFGSSNPATQFLTWHREQASEEDYCFLLIRPSGVDNFQAVLQGLEQSKTDFGFDLIAERQSVLHPDRGAAP